MDLALTRGDIVTVSLPGDYGKPRPAVVVTSALFADLPGLTLVPLTSSATSLDPPKVMIAPDAGNGLRHPSVAMVDKVSSIARHRIGGRLGRLGAREMDVIAEALALYLDLLPPGTPGP